MLPSGTTAPVETPQQVHWDSEYVAKVKKPAAQTTLGRCRPVGRPHGKNPGRWRRTHNSMKRCVRTSIGKGQRRSSCSRCLAKAIHSWRQMLFGFDHSQSAHQAAPEPVERSSQHGDFVLAVDRQLRTVFAEADAVRRQRKLLDWPRMTAKNRTTFDRAKAIRNTPPCDNMECRSPSWARFNGTLVENLGSIWAPTISLGFHPKPCSLPYRLSMAAGAILGTS